MHATAAGNSLPLPGRDPAISGSCQLLESELDEECRLLRQLLAILPASAQEADFLAESLGILRANRRQFKRLILRLEPFTDVAGPGRRLAELDRLIRNYVRRVRRQGAR